MIIEKNKQTNKDIQDKENQDFYTISIELRSDEKEKEKIIIRLECAIRIKNSVVVVFFYVLVLVDLFTEFGRNVAKPIAGKAKLIVRLIGECC